MAKDIKEQQHRQELFQKVAVEQLRTRAAGVLRGTARGVVTVCPQFLNDCAIITEAILQAGETFSKTSIKE